MIPGKVYEISVKSDKRNRKVKMKFIEELNMKFTYLNIQEDIKNVF